MAKEAISGRLSEAVLDTERLVCPSCSQGDIIRYGVRKGKQIYYCKTCKRRFTDNGAMPHRRISPAVVGDAIAAFYDGLSYRDIQQRIQVNHGFKPSTATIYEWVRDYVRRGTRLLSEFKADTGTTWVADEMMVRIDGKNVWLWNVMDARTRYLLATHLSPTRTTADAVTVFRKAKRHAMRPPTRIITDGLRAYVDGIEQVFGGDTKHMVSEGIRSHELNNNLIERLNGTVRERTKVMRGMETRQTGGLVMEGFAIHYNLMKPHHGLGGKTPAQAAGLPIVFRDWVDVAHLQESTVDHLRERPLKSRIFRTQRL